jgi:hypothetical protein
MMTVVGWSVGATPHIFSPITVGNLGCNATKQQVPRFVSHNVQLLLFLGTRTSSALDLAPLVVNSFSGAVCSV